MKIAVWHNLPSGGGKRALYNHVKGLVVRGHTVEAWCPSTADQTYLPLGELIVEHVLPFDWKPEEQDRRLMRYIATYRNIVSKLKAMDQHSRECAKEINQGGFDFLFANSCMFFRSTPIGRYVQLPKALYLQEPNRWLYEASPRLPWLALDVQDAQSSRIAKLQGFVQDWSRVQALRVQAREEWLSAKAYDAILVNSYFSRESILRAYGLDAKVCYLGVDTKKFAAEEKPRENFVVGLGAFDANKNFRFIIEALALVPEPRPALVWIGDRGDGSTIEALRDYARSVDVCFQPQVGISDRQLVDILNRGLLLAYAPRLEPFGYAPLEANACGLPVVAVAEGGVRETVVDGLNGLLVEHDQATMANAIHRLLNDRDYARKLGENGRRLVQEKWDVNASIDRLEQRFAQVIDAHS